MHKSGIGLYCRYEYYQRAWQRHYHLITMTLVTLSLNKANIHATHNIHRWCLNALCVIESFIMWIEKGGYDLLPPLL